MGEESVKEDRMIYYEKLHMVGKGAYGTVFLCRRREDNVELIMKEIPLDDLEANDRESAMKEVKILDKLKHPNIIRLYDSFIHGAMLIIIMEYAEGGTLFDFLQKYKGKGKTISEKKILHLFAQIAVSLSYIHSQRILHRDMKTSNIFLNKKMDVVKVGDFGISCILNSRSKALSIIGTPSYISPELCENQPYNRKSDIWALGCILYEMISLNKAFEALNLPALVKKILTAAVPPLTGKYSDDIKELVKKLLSRDPEQRPSIKDVLSSPLLINIFMDLPINIGRPKGISVAATVHPSSLASLGLHLEAEGLENKNELPATVYRWGEGLLKPTARQLPVQTEVEIVQVAIGRIKNIGLTSKGQLLQWETSVCHNSTREATDKEVSGESSIPKFIECHTGVSVSQVSCGDMFYACVTGNGILMTFGNGSNGCLGHGNLLDVKEPKIVAPLIGKQVVKVSCGAMHVMAVTADRAAFSWGKGDTGRLGHSNDEICNKPKSIILPDNCEPLSCFCGSDCSVIITCENKVLVCGGNRFNKIGLNNKDGTMIDECSHLVPFKLQPLSDLCVKEVAFGLFHTAFLTEKGECYTCGSNSFGQLGFPKTESNDLPYLVGSLEEKVFSHIACGDTFTVAVTTDDEIYTWGKGARGRLGTGNEEDRSTPTLVKFQEKLRLISLSAYRGTTVAVIKEVLS